MLKYLGKLNVKLLKKEYGSLCTDEVVVTEEREEHIKNHHMIDYSYFLLYAKSIVSEPDYVIKDTSNEFTIFLIKELSDTNLNMVIKLSLESENKKNSVLTFYRIRSKNLEKLIKKNGILYKRE